MVSEMVEQAGFEPAFSALLADVLGPLDDRPLNCIRLQ